MKIYIDPESISVMHMRTTNGERIGPQSLSYETHSHCYIHPRQYRQYIIQSDKKHYAELIPVWAENPYSVNDTLMGVYVQSPLLPMYLYSHHDIANDANDDIVHIDQVYEIVAKYLSGWNYDQIDTSHMPAEQLYYEEVREGLDDESE